VRCRFAPAPRPRSALKAPVSRASDKFKVLEANPKAFIFGEFIDESDGHMNRLEGSGILDMRTELDQFNTGSRLAKNDGAHAHPHPLQAPHHHHRDLTPTRRRDEWQPRAFQGVARH